MYSQNRDGNGFEKINQGGKMNEELENKIDNGDATLVTDNNCDFLGIDKKYIGCYIITADNIIVDENDIVISL